MAVKLAPSFLGIEIHQLKAKIKQFWLAKMRCIILRQPPEGNLVLSGWAADHPSSHLLGQAQAGQFRIRATHQDRALSEVPPALRQQISKQCKWNFQ